jgi:hypothetical protein
MSRSLALILFLAASTCAAQSDPKAEVIARAKELAATESQLARESASERLKSALRSLLEQPAGLTIALDELPLSRVDALDGSFRLITWNVPLDDGSHRYEGFLLARSGKLTTLFELRDQTASISNPELAELGPDRWYGALYYQVVPVKKGGRTWYTLLGWKGHSATETRKVIDVLSFRGGKPRFGAPLFGRGKLKEHRKLFAYSFQLSMMLHYDQEQGRIVLDHLSPMRADLAGKGALMGPDMSFDAFVWYKGQWRFERDIDLRDPKRDGKPFNAPPKDAASPR